MTKVICDVYLWIILEFPALKQYFLVTSSNSFIFYKR